MPLPEQIPPEPAIPPDQAAEDTRQSADVLRGFIDMGDELAKAIHRKAMDTLTEPDADPATPAHTIAADLAIQFDRITRSVRRSILLLAKLAEPKPTAYDRALADQKRNKKSKYAFDLLDRPTGELWDDELHERIVLEDRIDRLERIDRLDLLEDDDFPNRPYEEIIAEICEQLGIATIGDMISKEPGAVTEFANHLREIEAEALARPKRWADKPGSAPDAAGRNAKKPSYPLRI